MRLQLLGETTLNDVPISGQNRLILAWLALNAQSTASRAKLARELWMDEDESQGRRRLTKALYRIKQEFPYLEDHLEADNNIIALKNVAVDALEFQALLKSQNPIDWQMAFELYQGDLLEGEDAPWLNSWREHLSETYFTGLQRALGHAENPNQAISVAQRLVRYNPLSEEAHTYLIRLYVTANRREDAINQYATLEKTLHEELNSSPKPELRTYIQTLKHSLEPIDKPHHTLIGRNKELRMVAQQLEATQAGHGSIIALQGEPGMGKTRLLDELESLSRWHKIRVLRGTAKEQQSNAYAPLEQALQSQPVLLELATPLMRETLKPLLTEEANSNNSSSSAVGAALERWLGKLERPVLVVLDDLQWAGDLFWTLLPVLTRMTRQKAVLLVLSYRTYEIQTEPLAIEALNAMRQENAVLPLELGALTQDECAALAKATGKPLDTDELERLYRLSNGNPLVFLEFISGQDNSERLEAVVQNRLAHLSRQAQTALEAASVLGNTFGQEVWTAMLETNAPVQELLEARFLNQAGENLIFQHDLIRSSIYEGLKKEEKQKWHLKAMQQLSSRGERFAVLAYHAELGEQCLESISFLVQAAEEALLLTSFKETRRLIAQAQKNIEKLDTILPIETRRLRLIQLELEFIDNPTSGILEELKKLEIATKKSPDLEISYRIFKLKLDAINVLGNRQMYDQTATEFVQFFKNQNDIQLFVNASIEAADGFTQELFSPENAREILNIILPFLGTTRIDEITQMRLICSIIRCYQRLGRREEVATYLLEAERLFKEQPKLISFEPTLLAMKANAMTAIGDIEMAIKLHKESLEAYKTINNQSEIIATLGKIIINLELVGQYDESIILAEEMIERTIQLQEIQDFNKYAQYVAPLARNLAFLGDFTKATKTIQPLRAWLEDSGSGEGSVEAWAALGFIQRQQKNYNEAYHAFKRAFDLRQNSTYYLLLSAEAAHCARMQQEAKYCFEQVVSVKHILKKSHSLAQFHYLNFLLEKQAQDLEEARFHIHKIATKLSNIAYRKSLLYEFFTHKSIHEHWQQQDLTTITAELSRPDGIGTRQITWTIDSGASDQAHLEQSGKVALRHHRLKRLWLEAAVQDAIPTQEDFAQALGVTLRTIENDLATMRANGMEIRTLGMRKEMVKK